MRLIGHLADESAARTFADYLYVEGIENQLEHEAKDGWGVWVSEEDKLGRATELLSAFRANPQSPEFRERAKAAAGLRANKAKGETEYRSKLKSRRHLFRPLTPYGFGPLTFVLIVASVAVFFLSRFSHEPERVMVLQMTDWTGGQYDPTLPEIRHGQIWRLFTPIFVHYGILHLLFNMLWLRDLGSMIEARQSLLHLAVLVVVFAASSNLAQFYVGRSGPIFGGMSGVVYGLLGYIWMRGKFDPGSGLYLHPYTVTMMIIWFFLCYTGLVGPVANTAHAVGLILGMIFGFVSSLRYR